MRKTEKGKNISIYISDPNLLINLNKVARKIKINERKLIRNLINIGIEEMTIQNNIGLVSFTLLLKRFKDQWIDMKNLELETIDKKVRKYKTTPPFTIWLSIDVIKKLDLFTEKLELKSRSELAENVIKMGLKDINIFKKTGLLDMSIFIRDLWRKKFKKTKEAMKKGEVKLDDI